MKRVVLMGNDAPEPERHYVARIRNYNGYPALVGSDGSLIIFGSMVLRLTVPDGTAVDMSLTPTADGFAVQCEQQQFIEMVTMALRGGCVVINRNGEVRDHGATSDGPRD